MGVPNKMRHYSEIQKKIQNIKYSKHSKIGGGQVQGVRDQSITFSF